MNNRINQRQTLFMHLTFLLAILFSIVPLPDLINAFRPHWLAMMMAYWSLQVNNTRILYLAFGYGLLFDVMMGSLLGKHGMSLVALAFLVNKSAKQLRMTSFWQLLFMVLVWLFNDIVIRSVIDWVSAGYPPQLNALLPLVSAALVWPWLKYFMDHFQLKIKNRA